jgi:hypothetical protein
MTTTHAITTTRPVTSNRAKALGWLAHGAELAIALKGDRAKHADVIWGLIVEAVEAIDKTADSGRNRPPFRDEIARGEAASSGSDRSPPFGFWKEWIGCRWGGLQCAMCAR